MLDDDTCKTKNRMPQLFMNDLRNKKTLIKSWWRQLKRSKTNDKDDTTLDWRSLSPDKPPLPFFIPDKSTTSVHHDTSVDKKPISSMPALLADTTLIDPAHIESPSSTSSSNSSNTKSPNSRSNTFDNYQPLCPILEESETMATESNESNESNVLQNGESQMQRQNSTSSQTDRVITDIVDNKQSVSNSVAAAPSTQEPANDLQQPEPPTCPSPPITSPSVKTETSTPWSETKATQKTPTDQFMPLDLVGNEHLCKRKFAKMVLAANKFQQHQQQQIQVPEAHNERPSEMALLFDEGGNIDMMRMVRQGKSEYHKFCGNSQYVPPELSVNVEYHSELADVWVLGVFLYRMLVGRYPFSASNDQQLFKKMLNSDFSIPNELSEDAKDLIKRMLAPDSSRASLDLIIYHPWLKPYRPLLLDRYHHTIATGATMKANRPMYIHSSSNSTKTTIAKRPPATNAKQRSILNGKSIRRSNSVNTTTPSTNSSATNEPKYKKTKHNAKNKGFIKKAFSLLLQGPFPPPKKPYQALAHLGTRESVFAKHKV
ncbi:hypothetical protein [Parasitella parasitica]|uniref:Protein kinase domain-containing protein n=1 Tax=Parasitella parasitica TaxID=35722 RepID=A0A0B7NC12_9FUNG|nr:hypothetical protein [Parasitella parasitica]